MQRLPDDSRPGPGWLSAIPHFPAVLAVAALGLTILAAGLLRHAEQQRVRSDLERLGRDRTAAIEYGLAQTRLGVELLAAFFHSSQEVTREEFRSFVQPYLRREPYLQAMGWVPIVPHSARRGYESRARREGFPAFRFTELDSMGALVAAEVRVAYFPVFYLQPHEGNQEAFGFDLGSDAVRRDMLQQAGIRGQLTSSPPIPILPHGTGRPVFLLLAPVGNPAAEPTSSGQATTQVTGYTLAVLRPDRLIHQVLSHSRAGVVDVHVFHIGADGRERLLGSMPVSADAQDDAEDPAAALHGRLHHARRIEVGGQTWEVLTAPAPEFRAGRLTKQPWIVLVAGLAVSALLTAYITALKRSAGRTHAFALAQSQSRSALEREAEQRRRAEDEIRSLNVGLERRVALRTEQLEAANRELSAFAYSVSHDLRAPLRAVNGFSQILLEDHGEQLDATGREHLERICHAARRMGELIDDLLSLSRLTQAELTHTRVDLSGCARAILEELQLRDPDRDVTWTVAPGITVDGDEALLRAVLENLLGNAWKFTARRPRAEIEFGVVEQGGETVYVVRDNGAGFDMRYADKLFGAFQRLHSSAEYEGHGIGLATVQRIIHRHGGRAWAVGEVDRGAAFYFTLGAQSEREASAV